MTTKCQNVPVGQTIDRAGNSKGGSIHCTIDLLFDCFELVCFANKNKTKIVSCHAAYSKPVKQEINSTVILSLLVFPG
jgi:hypothetical protein